MDTGAHLAPRLASIMRAWAVMALVLISGLTLSACQPKEVTQAQQAREQAEQSLSQLRQVIEAGQLPNQKKLQQYADVVAAEAKDDAVRNVVETLKQEGTTAGGLYSLLDLRLTALAQALQAKTLTISQANDLTVEGVAIARAAEMDAFNDALTDPINVLADMSPTLARVHIPDDADKGLGASQHLVGNPAYGQWQTDSNGSSFWAWYGQYALLNQMVGGVGDALERKNRRYDRSTWYERRSPSYYGDVGRYYYGTTRSNSDWAKASSSSGRQTTAASQKWAETNAKAVKSFGSAQRLSTYQPVTTTVSPALRNVAATTTRSSTYGTTSKPSTAGTTSRSSGTKPSTSGSTSRPSTYGSTSRPSTYGSTSRPSTYSLANTRSAPSRSGGFGGARRGK